MHSFHLGNRCVSVMKTRKRTVMRRQLRHAGQEILEDVVVEALSIGKPIPVYLPELPKCLLKPGISFGEPAR